MTLDDQKEQFSFAYVRAVAAAAQVAVSEPSVDDDSVDLLLKKKGGGGPVRSPQVDIQVKCTENVPVLPQHIPFPLKLKNYDELRTVDLLVPRILVVVIVPQLVDWLNHSEQEMAMRKCGYWMSLRGMAATPNAVSVAVRIPRINQFNVAQLQRIGNRQHP